MPPGVGLTKVKPALWAAACTAASNSPAPTTTTAACSDAVRIVRGGRDLSFMGPPVRSGPIPTATRFEIHQQTGAGEVRLKSGPRIIVTPCQVETRVRIADRSYVTLENRRTSWTVHVRSLTIFATDTRFGE